MLLLPCVCMKYTCSWYVPYQPYFKITNITYKNREVGHYKKCHHKHSKVLLSLQVVQFRKLFRKCPIHRYITMFFSSILSFSHLKLFSQRYLHTYYNTVCLLYAMIPTMEANNQRCILNSIFDAHSWMLSSRPCIVLLFPQVKDATI